MITGTESLPGAPDAESYIVGALCRDPSQIRVVERRLAARDFTVPAHREALRTIVKMDRDGNDLHVVAIKHALEANPEFVKLVDSVAAYLAEVGSAAATKAHLGYYIDAVADKSLKRRLHLLAVDTAAAAVNGKSSTEVLADLLSEIEDVRREFVDTKRFRTLSAKELDSGDFSVEFLVAWLLVKGQPCILAGGKKCLKTTLLIALGLALATGNEYLGKFRTRGATRFLLCSGESGLATIQETARRIARWMGWELAEVPNFVVTDDLPRLDDDVDLSEFRSLLERTEAEVVAIDPAYLCLGGDDHGNLFKQGALLLRVSQLCNELGVTPILCHHTRKHRAANVDTFDPPELEDIAWAGFQEFARQWLLVGRRELYDPGSGVHRLWLNVGGSVGHGGLWALDVTEGRLDDPQGRTWAVAIAKASEAKQAAQKRKDEAKAKRSAEQVEADRKAICEAVVKLPGQAGTKNKIRDATGFNTKRFDPAFAAAIKARDLAETTVTASNGQTYDGYKLSLDDDESDHSDPLGFHSDSEPNPSVGTHTRTPPLKGESESVCVGMAESESLGSIQGESE